ncbi:hypothetical protein MRB53_001245 [Persea americana]|uniref:Uncharacterized protein n=1 Tax=Persea americana TaxID=3435 RepID=A0ACC2MR23_PERAE|nr:hypothetical protein MRB53_001245 [Persea americana]
MEMTLLNPSPSCCFSNIIRNCKPKVQNAGDSTFSPLNHFKQNKPRSKKCNISFALPETAASVLVAAVAVGAAATILRRTTKAQETVDSPSKVCEDCGGSGICAECNGEGFVLKKLTEESADKARLAAKNMATRYTAGLPKKWSYCSKCSSARSCSTCGGRGRVRTCSTFGPELGHVCLNKLRPIHEIPWESVFDLRLHLNDRNLECITPFDLQGRRLGQTMLVQSSYVLSLICSFPFKFMLRTQFEVRQLLAYRVLEGLPVDNLAH